MIRYIGIAFHYMGNDMMNYIITTMNEGKMTAGKHKPGTENGFASSPFIS